MIEIEIDGRDLLLKAMDDGWTITTMTLSPDVRHFTLAVAATAAEAGSGR